MAVHICQGCGTEYGQWPGKCPACGNTESIRLNQQEDHLVGRVVKSKFKIIKKLGQGGMGAVYLAEQVGIGQKLALKFLKSEFSTDPELARRFLNEAKSYARVAHPNAVTLHDFGQDDDGNLFIAMEYCEGVDLKKVLTEQGRLQLGEAIEVVLQVADVLANAHAKGVVHRDLKPENIMIRRGMRGVHAKVLDFGIARLMNDGTKLTMAGAIAGTPRYMSPEQVAGMEVDHRADIYSLGIVLYESLTGQQPFDGTTIAEIMRKQSVEPLPHLRDVLADLDYPDLDRVLQRACAKNRDERWPDLIAFAHALSHALPTQTGLAMPLQLRSAAGQGVGLATETGNDRAATGVAVPGTATGADATGATMLRAGSGPPTAVGAGAHTAPDLSGAAKTMHGGPVAVSPTSAPLGNLSLPPTVPQSNGPKIAAIALAVLALGVMAFVVFSGPSKPVGEPVPKVDPPPKPVEVAQPTPPKPDERMVPLADAKRELLNTAALEFLGRGRTYFANAELDAAQTQLEGVKEESDSFADAKELLQKIATIKERLKTANALKAQGHCDRALPVYQEVLKLNPKVHDAQQGVAVCRAGTVSTTME